MNKVFSGLVILISVFCQIPSVGQALISLESFHDGLAAAREMEVWGFIDKKGKWAISPQFEMVYMFSEGLAGFYRTGKWGFVDKKGNWAIQPVFNEVRPFSEGLALARDKKNLWGYIDKNGSWVIAAQYAQAQSFSEGLAAVTVNDQVRFIRKDGSTAINGNFLLARDFKHGYAFVNQNGKHYWINEAGEKKMECPGPVFYGEFAYSDGFDVSEGLVSFKAAKGNVLGYQDVQGNVIIPAQYVECKSFHKGVALVKTQKQNWIIIDQRGKPLTDESSLKIYPELWPTDYIKASLKTNEDHTATNVFYGVIDLKGQWKIKPAYLNLGSFSEGLIAAFDPKTLRFGYLNIKGKWKIKPRESEEMPMDEGKVEEKSQD